MSRTLQFVLLPIAVFLATCSTTNQASGAIVASLGGSPLANNTSGQFLDLFLFSDSGPLDFTSMDVTAQISGAPVTFQVPTAAEGASDGAGGIDFVWDSLPSGILSPPSFNVNGAGNEAIYAIAANNARDAVFNPTGEFLTLDSPPVLVARFMVDTTGVFDTTVNLDLVQTGGSSTRLSDGILAPVQTNFDQPLTFVVGAAAVPEPGSIIALAGVFALGGVRRWRGKQGESTELTVA